ncbi:MAG TPA: hypothetical protein VI279_04165, partial [Rhodocyclaceae bacterium]
HRIKAPARALGAGGLADLCEALEGLRHGQDLDQAAQIVGRLRPMAAQVTRELETNAWLENQDGEPQ